MLQKFPFPPTIEQIAIINASHVTKELPIALLHAIQNVHPHPDKIFWTNDYQYNNPHILYIIICPAGYGSESYRQGPLFYITYQLEPSAILKREPYLHFLANALYSWDYS